MKSKKLIILGVIAVLSIGSVVGIKAFSNASDNTISNEKVMAKNVAVETENKNQRELALEYFQVYMNEKVDVKNLYEKSETIDVDGQKVYAIHWSTTNDNNVENWRYTAAINIKTNELISLQYLPQKPNNKNYKSFSYKEGKNLAIKFIQENNLLGNKDYKLENEKSVQEDKRFPSLYNNFIFEYDGVKRCEITVSNDLKKVTQVKFSSKSENLG